jgi:hypothetical protein
MKRTGYCQCQSACQTKRCACLKEGRRCDPNCSCQNCTNPFNRIENAEQLSDCARSHVKSILALSDFELSKKHELPCGCTSVSLKSLIENYTCQKCDEPYYYSFCLGDVVDTNSMWHCAACGSCCDDGVWHCKRCNKCSYGLTLACEHCGKKSPYTP